MQQQERRVVEDVGQGYRQDLRRGASATDPSPAVLAHVDCESSGPMREAHCEKFRQRWVI